MAEQVKTVTHGLVLRETETKESDKILTVLTAQEGKISVIARGARRKNSRLAAACQLFVWSEMTLYKRGNWYYLDAAEPVELFGGLQTDLVNFSLAAYLCELTEFVAGEDTPAQSLLRLLLNGLYALAYLGKAPSLVKPAFTFRLLALAGFEPMTEGCAVCGTETADAPVYIAANAVPAGRISLCLSRVWRRCGTFSTGRTRSSTPSLCKKMTCGCWTGQQRPSPRRSWSGAFGRWHTINPYCPERNTYEYII